MTLMLRTAPVQGFRNQHWVVPNGRTLPIRVGLVEDAIINLIIRSQDFVNGVWSSANLTKTANACQDPFGTTLGTRVQKTNVGVGSPHRQTFTSTGNGFTFSCFARMGSGPNEANIFGVNNDTTATGLTFFRVNYETGAITILTGSQPVNHFRADRVGPYGWWRVSCFIPSGVQTVGDTISIYPGFIDNPFEPVNSFTYLFGAMVNEGRLAQYVTSVASQGVKQSDEITIPLAFPPQPLTVYARGIELGTLGAGGNKGLFGLAGAASPSMFVVNNGSDQYICVHRNASGVDANSGPASGTIAVGDLVEIRATLSDTGSVQIHQTINEGAETSGTASPAQPLSPGWAAAQPFIYVGSRGNSFIGRFGFTHLVAIPGIVSRDQVRSLLRIG